MSMSTTAPSTATSSASGASSAPSIPHSTPSTRSMALDTVSTSNEEADLRLKWSGRFSLKHRILALNLLTVLLVALSTIYLDAFRNRLSEERARQTKIEAAATASALNAAGSQRGAAILAAVSRSTGSRLRLYGGDGQLLADSWSATGPTYRLEDPSKQIWTYRVARALDRGFNVLVGARRLDPFVEPPKDRLQAWPEGTTAQRTGRAVTMIRNAPDLTPVISAAAPVGVNVLLVTTNDPAFTRTVRDQRGFILAAMAVLITISVLLSSFLARTRSEEH